MDEKKLGSNPERFNRKYEEYKLPGINLCFTTIIFSQEFKQKFSATKYGATKDSNIYKNLIYKKGHESN